MLDNRYIPLAQKIRPKTINDIVGQEKLLSNSGIVFKMIQKKIVRNIIFYGNPGIGKTTISQIICNSLNIKINVFNAANDHKEKLIDFINKKTNTQNVVIIEEIHRLNKDKQDILLQYIEDGIITIIACTTENPYFAINPAIRSRCIICELEPIKSIDLFKWLKNKNDNNVFTIHFQDNILKIISDRTNGDVRSAINIIDILTLFYKNEEITPELIDTICFNNLGNLKNSDNDYYDTLSAFHKSIRGSDPDAAIYYLGRLLLKKDFISINRRLIACVYEDIGLANAPLCSRVIQSCHAADMVGWPECKQIYGSIVIEMCLSPKSNSAIKAIDEAIQYIKNNKLLEIPHNIKDNNYAYSYKITENAYIYPHNFPNHYIEQQYLPDEIKNIKFYHPCSTGNEIKLNSIANLFKSKNINE